MSTEPTLDTDAVPAGSEALLAELREAAEAGSREHRWNMVLLRSSAGCYLGVRVAMHFDLPLPHACWRALIVLYFLSLAVLVSQLLPFQLVTWLLFRKSRKKRRLRMEKLLAELSGDTRSIGAIAQLCRQSEATSNIDAPLDLLLKMLPQVKASDARFVSDSQMEALLSLLVVRNQFRIDSQRAKEMPLAILNALKQIGDGRAIDPVRRLTTGRNNRLVHQAARECLAILEQHSADREYSRTLLLPIAEEANTEMLLRATHWQAETPSELLLRAVTEETRD
ncbi:MAG: hypothetical protein JWN14_1698 [Chthonomonadales bacterium]|nr:hypothetical protein [Chthonomonadales bacterium]